MSSFYAIIASVAKRNFFFPFKLRGLFEITALIKCMGYKTPGILGY